MRISKYAAVPSVLLMLGASGSACVNGVGPDTRQRDSSGWVSCSTAFVPLDDATAADYVQPAPEQRPDNAVPNTCVMTSAMVNTFLNGETDSAGQTPVQRNPYNAFVTGQLTNYISIPTTDQIIQWAAIKWGIPPDWLRATIAQQSNWQQNKLACSTTVAASSAYPAQSQIDATHAYQCMGMSQIQWDHPDANTRGTGTEPFRWESTPFAADYLAAKIRFFFDNPGGVAAAQITGYSACQNWNSIGAWAQASPWGNSAQQSMVTAVQGQLASRPWAQPGF